MTYDGAEKTCECMLYDILPVAPCGCTTLAEPQSDTKLVEHQCSLQAWKKKIIGSIYEAFAVRMTMAKQTTWNAVYD